MTMDRDDLIRTALTPSADLVVPADLGDALFAQLATVPQRRAGWTAPLRRLLPEAPTGLRPAMTWAVIALLLLAAAIALVGVASRLTPTIAPDIVSYRGHASQDGVLLGPGPSGIPDVSWDVELPGPMNNLSVPLARDGVLYLVDTRGGVLALDAATGARRWAGDELGSETTGPVLVGESLVVAAGDGTVTALDATTGATRWSTPLGIPVIAPLAGSDGQVVVSSPDGAVVILDGEDGSELRRVDAGGPVNRSPAIAGGVVYVVTDTGLATAFELATGRIHWQTDLTADDPEPLTSPEALTPVFANDTVYLTRGSLDKAIPHEVVAIDAASGTVDWRWSSPTLDRFFIGAVTADTVYTVGEDGAVRAFDPDGTHPRQIAQAGGAMGSPASIVDDTFYVGSADGLVHALDRHSGSERWSVDVGGIPTFPVVADGRVHIGTSVGHAVTIADPS